LKTTLRSFCLLPVLWLSLVAEAQQRDPEWPCVQVLVPEIVAAVVWPQVIDESISGTWRQNDALAAMAVKLSDLDEFAESEQRLIAEFVATVPLDARSDTLNRLADAIVSLSNRRRTQYIAGIKRYTRQQISDVVKLFDTPQLSGILHFQTLFFIIVRADITQRRM